MNAVNEPFVQLNKSVIAEFNDRAWELVHHFLAKAPFRISEPFQQATPDHIML